MAGGAPTPWKDAGAAPGGGMQSRPPPNLSPFSWAQDRISSSLGLVTWVITDGLSMETEGGRVHLAAPSLPPRAGAGGGALKAPPAGRRAKTSRARSPPARPRPHYLMPRPGPGAEAGGAGGGRREEEEEEGAALRHSRSVCRSVGRSARARVCQPAGAAPRPRPRAAQAPPPRVAAAAALAAAACPARPAGRSNMEAGGGSARPGRAVNNGAGPAPAPPRRGAG